VFKPSSKVLLNFTLVLDAGNKENKEFEVPVCSFSGEVFLQDTRTPNAGMKNK
jgi:hypothetical protein